MGLFKFKKKKDSTETKQEKMDELFSDSVSSVSEYVKEQEKERERQSREAVKTIDYISSGIKQSSSNPGFLRSYDVAVSEAKKVADELHNNQRSNVIEDNPDVTIAKELVEKWRESDRVKLTEEKLKVFYDKFPQFLEIKQILEDREKGTIDPKVDEILSLLEKNTSQKFPNFVLDDLLVPFLVEKRAMKLSTIDENLFLARKYNNAFKLGMSESQYEKIIVEYIKIIVALFYKIGKETSNFAQDFTTCLDKAFAEDEVENVFNSDYKKI